IEKETPPPPVEEPPPPPPEPEPEPAVEEPEAVMEAPEPDPERVYEDRTEEPAPEEPAPAEPIAQGYQELAPPSSVPDRLPDVDASAPAVRPEDFSGIGVAGGVARGTEGGEARNAAKDPPKGDGEGEGDVPSGPVDVNVVEERPKLTNGAEMERVLQRLYPSTLKDAGVTGTAVLQFVVDTEGRVESSSVQVVSSSHDGFGSASREAAERFKFRPAKIGGRPVRVSITMPIQWKLER
ncbi:MAG TPA: TonB family protein, partial [Longimicrobiaceae bacterium]